MVTRTGAEHNPLKIAVPGTKESAIPDVKIPPLERRRFLVVAGAALTSFLSFVSGFAAKSASNEVSTDINARPEPVNTQEYDEMLKEFLNLDELQEIYNKHFGKLLDSRDGKPLLSMGAFINTMLWSQVPLKIQYDQIDEKTQEKPEFKDFVDEYMTDICDMSEKVEMRPEVFLITSAISGQNIVFSGGQDEDVQVYKAQITLGAIREKFGEDPYEYMRKQLLDPDSFIFSKRGKTALEFASKHLGLNLNTESLRPVPKWHAVRLDNPTTGTAMDIELVMYAQGYKFVKDHYPAAAEYFSDFSEATQALEALSNAKIELEKERAKLKKVALEFAKDHPEAFEDFFNEDTAEEAFAKIGIDRNASATLDYTYGSYAGYRYDFKHGLVFIADDPYKRTNEKERQNYVVDETIKHFLGLAKLDKQGAIESLMADQIFNDKFINYLVGKTVPKISRGPAPISRVLHFLGTFDAQKRNFLKVREQSYQPLGKLEYDRKFQAALAIATTRFFHEEVTDEFPELKSKKGDFTNMRSKAFADAYHISEGRELSSFNAMLGIFGSPDEHPPYNNPKNFKLWREYFNAFVSAGLVSENDLVRNFAKFANAEADFLSGKLDDDMNNSDHTKRQLDLIKEKHLEITGNMYTGLTRAQSLVSMLMLRNLN